ncbi:bifunctional allantoicase/(S)-ureidoglycine aminohydrolase [Alisedimentitalea sp. MJ-SS2]|uniref:bifunctional allantoicase/(S)-ureidoglycine aminohydrolase n=1 Tax=Aliisedimentitalea sp. MJ-SS2 TaxID=3049795 RepID=UPI002912920D|nr:bifunctional allantoicase/(S)-ureidoglycine aminohydrolase [Alisedimentitalea sp. MJ-SS2]MDU8927739.1 bifunctional allantoicase/(S)-ureidoglycine aminohydrolase [Alisedimentitalea sp. MJ-SS2]
MSYAFPPGGLPPMDANPEGSAVFSDAYAVIPANTMRDIVTSSLPGWEGTRVWILARPLSGFAETFAQYAVEVAPGGGSHSPDPDPQAQASLFVTGGQGRLRIGKTKHKLEPGHYAYLPAGCDWRIKAMGDTPLQFHWIRKRHEPVPGLPAPGAFVVHERDVPLNMMPGTDKWGTQRFADPNDLRFDYHVNIVTFQPGGRIPFAETHVMEHGLYVLQGQAQYLLNTDWVEVGPGDFMWLRAFCPQACIATGNEPFRYLLYKDVNRHPSLTL